MEYRIDLEAFGGPMDLLLYLVRKNEIDIHDIPIAEVLEQYLEHMKLLTHLDVDGVGEFLVMASTLMEIKSRMLLPQVPVDDEDEPEDPRTDLVRQLLEYKRFKEVSEELDDMRHEQARRFPRGSSGEFAGDEDEEGPRLELDDLTLWDLCAAYSEILREIELSAEREVVFDDTPVEEHMNRILYGLKSSRDLSFRSIFPRTADRGTLVGLFVALLELVREKKVRIVQERDFGDIRIRMREEPAETAGTGAETEEVGPTIDSAQVGAATGGASPEGEAQTEGPLDDGLADGPPESAPRFVEPPGPEP